MRTQFPNHKSATVETNELNGEKRISFEYNELDYIFYFDPNIDDTPGGLPCPTWATTNAVYYRRVSTPPMKRGPLPIRRWA